MNKILTAILCASLALPAIAADRIEVKPDASVAGPVLRLGDVATISGEDIDLLKDIEIGPAALPGQTRVVQASLIKSSIERQGFDLSSLEINGAENVRATTSHLALDKAGLEKDLRHFIELEMPWEAANTTVDVVAPNFEVVLPEGQVTIDWRCSPTYRYLGTGSFRGDVKVNGEVQRSVLCRADIEAYGEVVVAATDIPRGAIFSEKNLTIEPRALSTVPRNTIEDPGELLGQAAKRTLFLGQILTTSHACSRTLIKRNQIVSVEAQTDALRVHMQAKALADGGEGDAIPCQNTSSKQEFVGIIQPGGTVQVK